MVPPIPTDPTATLGDYRRYPGCRLRLACAACGWAKDYNPERIIARLHELRAGGYPTPVHRLAARVAWNCPCCGRVKWRVDLAWPPTMTESEIKRLAHRQRN